MQQQQQQAISPHHPPAIQMSPPPPPSHAYTRPSVHILFDFASLACPSHVPLAGFLSQLQGLASQYGEIVAFTMPLLSTSAHMLDASARATCREFGVTIEEISAQDPSSESFLLTRLLRLTLEMQHSASTSAAPKTSVILLSNRGALASSLALMRHSSLFANIVLVHSADAPSELIASASASLTTQEFLAGAPPKANGDKSAHERGPSGPQVPPAHPVHPLAASPPGLATFRRPTQLATSPTEGEAVAHGFSSLLGVHPSQASPSQGMTASPSQALLPLPPSAHPQSTSPSKRFLTPSHQHQSGLPSPSGGKQVFGRISALSAPSSPTQHRSFFGSPTHHANASVGVNNSTNAHAGINRGIPQHQSPSGATGLTHPAFFHRGGSDHTRERSHHSSSSSSSAAAAAASARTRACLSSYARIIAYCESEKLIPRESVLKKRLVDSKLQLGDGGGGGGGIEFEEFLATIVHSGVGVMEGEAPQRIVWPRGADGQARQFPCADFFTPVSRLSPEQNAELLEFLYAVQPEVERGRFGMATWLGAHGPPFVRLLAHGVLVELVQLLLNRKVLLFRKGRVSVASRTEASEAASLGLLFSAADFATPAGSRLVSPAVSRPTSPALTGMEQGIWHQDETPINVSDDPWRAAPPASLISAVQPNPSRTLFSSFSLPTTRATSPVQRLRSPPGLSLSNVSSTGDLLRTRPPSLPSATGIPPVVLEKRKSISSLLPLKPEVRMPPARSIFDQTAATTVGHVQFDALPMMHAPTTTTLNGNAKEFESGKSLWMKEEPMVHSGSATGSAYASRRSSMSDLDSWRLGALHASGHGSSFESHSGFTVGGIGESASTDACDPAAVLAVKLARLNSDYLSLSSTASGGPLDELARFTSAVEYRPCFHFEKSGAAHTPEWVCQVAFSIGQKRYQTKSHVHTKKDLAKNEVCMKVLQMIEDDAALAVALQSEGDTTAVDSVVDLARLLNFLQQAPVVYYLTRASPSAAVGAARFDQARVGLMVARRHSISGPSSGHYAASSGAFGHGVSGAAQSHASSLWHGSTRIQVKSVNILTGEAQPTVSASTPFTHSVTAPSKHEAKEQIAANLLAQIQRARVVNPALFTVLSAARHKLAMQGQHQRQTTAGTAPPRSSGDSILWSNTLPASALQAPISAPSLGGGGVNVPPPVDVSSASFGAPGGASLFSLHTPVAGHAYSGISAIGLATPIPTMSRTVSEAQNAAAQATSTASAERALED